MSKPAIEFSRNLATNISWQERLFLLEHLTGKPIPSIVSERTTLTSSQESLFVEMIKEREKGKPFDLIVGRKRFLDFDVEVEPGVFIPRPETEELLENVFAKISDEPELAVDLCTGTGVIAIALAKRFPNARILATDLSPAALSLAGRNALSNGVADRITFKKADLLGSEDAQNLEKKINLLVSNPPYVPTSVIDTLEKEVKLYDPLLALDGGPDGSNVVKRILDLLPRFLSPGGLAAIEIDPCLEKPLERYEKEYSLVLNREVDISGNLRFLYARYS